MKARNKNGVRPVGLTARRHGRRNLVFLGLTMAFAAGNASAFQIETDNPDLRMTLDTTLRYNALWRAEGRDPGLVSPATDEGQFIAGKGDLALSRLDAYTEFDLTMRNDYGLRLSAAAWYDTNFDSRGKSDPRYASIANYPGNEFPGSVTRYYRGPSAEFMDAFVWTNLQLGETQLNAKVGRFAWLPGEFLFGNGSSFTYSMAPNDGRKSDLSPGSSAKETAIPIGQAGLSWQLNSDVSVLAQYTGEFRSSRISEGGTFFAIGDGATLTAPFLTRVPVDIPRKEAREGDKGDVALGVRWSPQSLGGNALSFWYRKFDDKSPTWLNQVSVGPTGARQAQAVYAKDIELYGLAYNAHVGSWAVGAELNYRKNMPLAVRSGVAYGTFPGLVQDASLEGPRGDTYHALLSGVMTINKNSFFDSGSVAVQLDYMYLDEITKHKNLFNGSMSGQPGVCADNEILRGCSTRHAASVAMSFTPMWQQALPSVDVSMPVVFLYGLHGNPAATNAGILPEGSYLARIGGRLEWFKGQHKHQFDLSYTRRDGDTGVLPGATATSYSGLANFRDRDYVSFTYSTAF